VVNQYSLSDLNMAESKMHMLQPVKVLESILGGKKKLQLSPPNLRIKIQAAKQIFLLSLQTLLK